MPPVRAQGKVLAAMIDTKTNEMLEKLLKVALSSDKDGEVIAAANAIRRTLAGAGSDIHELAARVKGGKIPESEMKRVYDAGYQEGKDSAATAHGFSNTEGPSWLEMAEYCANNDRGRLTPKESGFVDDMVGWCARREPSEKQGKWLHSIYVKLRRRR
jgi:hypothetical protein